MQPNSKIPVVVGVTGHRNIVEEDKPALKAKVTECLKEIQDLCRGKRKGEEDTPVVMLNAFAQGSDMLCAEAAFDLGIDVYAVLPCGKEKYKKSFDLYRKSAEAAGNAAAKDFAEAAAKDEADKEKLEQYLSDTDGPHVQRMIYAPDIETDRARINLDEESYEYRQLGIYVAEHSHVLLALWDGKPPKGEYGCGTAEVIRFALEHKYPDKDMLFRPGIVNDSAVFWIKSRRQGDGAAADIQKKWMTGKPAEDGGELYGDFRIFDDPPGFLKDIVSKTVNYNAENVSVPDDAVRLWKNVEGLDEYRKNLRRHYAKADELSYGRNQKKYNLFILLLAIIGTVVACTFLIYDDASLPYMIFPCTAAICLILWLILRGKRKAYHKKYIEYRALAEALRIQFYMSMCLGEKTVVTNVCDLYAWSQKLEMVWIKKAIQALGVIGESDAGKADATGVIDVWIGNNEKPKGQLRYHSEKKDRNRTQALKYEKLSKISSAATVGLYFLIFILEIAACILKASDIRWFWEGNIFAHVTWRNFAAIVIGIVTAASLLFSSYWGKLSYDRKADDNEKMSKFYASACERWNEIKKYGTEIEKFVKEIAREEIVENGIWCSYVNENRLEINI